MGAKADILEAAVELFSTFGFHKTTMDMIAREANVAKGTLYWHFKSKQDLFVGIIEADMDRFHAYLEKVKNNEQMTSRQKVEMIIDQKFEFFHKFQTLVREVMSSYQEINDDFAVRMEEIRLKHVKTLMEIFAEGKDRGEFAIEDPEIVAIAFLGISMTMSGCLEMFKEKSNEGVIRTIKQFVLTGILSS